jgi:hypothetical protein
MNVKNKVYTRDILIVIVKGIIHEHIDINW